MRFPFFRRDPDEDENENEEEIIENEEVSQEGEEFLDVGMSGVEEVSSFTSSEISNFLDYFSRYPEERLRPEFKELGKMVIDPAPLMGYASGTDIAQIINLIEVQRLHYMAVPEALKGDSYMVFDLFVAVAKPIINLTKYGRLIQAVTGRRMEHDIPDYIIAYMLRQKELELQTSSQGRIMGGGEQ